MRLALYISMYDFGEAVVDCSSRQKVGDFAFAAKAIIQIEDECY